MILDELARNIVAYYGADESLSEEQKDELFDRSFMPMCDLISESPEMAWDVICKVVELTEDQWVLTMLGCGELESLLFKCFEQFIDRVEARSRECKKFAFVMSCVWQNRMTDEQYKRLDDLVKELGIERI